MSQIVRKVTRKICNHESLQPSAGCKQWLLDILLTDCKLTIYLKPVYLFQRETNPDPEHVGFLNILEVSLGVLEGVAQIN